MSVASAGDLCGTLFKHYPLGHCYAELQSHNVGTVVKIHLQRYCRPGAKRDIGGRDGVSLRKNAKRRQQHEKQHRDYTTC